jgi:LmbE family N-acetylglucosaminyl deacetylase
VTTPVPDLGTILSVWAHPDDESYCCAGLMAVAARAGHRVVCVTATRGELGSTDETRWPNGPELAEVRTAELAACLAEIGVREHHWLDYADGGCAGVDPAEPISRLRALAEEVQPDAVLTFGPDGATYHPDHIAVSRWVTEAVRGTGTALLYTSVTPEWQKAMSTVVDPKLVMMTDDEPLVHTADQLAVCSELDGDLLDMKYRAMMCQESQIGPLLDRAGPATFRRLLALEAFRDGWVEAGAVPPQVPGRRTP